MFLQLNPSWNGSYKSALTKQAENYFKESISRGACNKLHNKLPLILLIQTIDFFY